MELALPVLISVDERDRHEVRLPGVSSHVFKGTSLAALLDDVALHLMEHIPKEPAERMPSYELCPEVELRKLRITAQIPTGERKETKPWSGRLSVVLSRWPEDPFWTAVVPRLGLEKIAVKHPAALEAALIRHITAIAVERGTERLDAAVSARREHLEILAFDTELPSILPSQPIVLGARKKKKKKADALTKAPPEKEKKRVLVPPLMLRQVATNLTHRALDGRLARAHRMERVVDDLAAQLAHGGAGILLVGASGVGKTAVVHALVQKLAAAARTLEDRRDVWQVDGNRIISGMSVVGAWESRLGAMVSELSQRLDILYVSDLPALVYTGRSAHSDSNVAKYLEPHLQRGELRIIGECTPERLLSARDEAPGFFARFRVVWLDEMSEKDALGVLVHQARALEKSTNTHADPDALEAILALTRRFEPRRAHPGKAVTLLDRVAADHEKISTDNLGRRRLSRTDVIDAYARQTGLPRFVLWEGDARAPAEVREFFQRRIIAQPRAVEAAEDVVALLEQGLNDPGRPIATYLFVGPTGVGKTETAKALAELLFGSPDRMVRFDMSELLSADSVARLFGDRLRPDGELTRRIEQQPFAVILLDEIEKAHPSVFDALLQVLGEGRLTNAAGRTVDFTSTVIIMTSNLGARDAGRSLGFGEATESSLAEHYLESAQRWFRPEFINRIDRVVPFASLGRDSIAPLVARHLELMLGRRGLRRQPVVIDVDPELVNLIVDQGFDPRYGARSIKRVLEAKLAVPLARHLVAQDSAALTRIELFPRGNSLDLLVEQPPLPVALSAETKLPSLLDWPAVERRHAALAEMLEQLSSSSSVQALAQEHSALVERSGHSRARADEAQDRLQSLSELLQEFGSLAPAKGAEPPLARALEDFQRNQLELEPFVERIEDETVPDYTGKNTRSLFLPQVRAVRLERGPLRKETALGLEDLELRAAALAYRVRSAAKREKGPLLLRMLPISHDRATQTFAYGVARAFAECWGRWGICRLLGRAPSGQWSYLEGEPGEITASAVELIGAGLAGVVRPELGYWLDTSELGADRVSRLVRVEEADASPGSLAQLNALDAARQAHLGLRRQGEASSDPWGPLPLVRSFARGATLDRATGLKLELPSLATDLYKVAMRRVFAEIER